ncbi:MAG: DUF488 family protein [Deltaproteobacteria bacterium]|nr:DUF488 family protein [Deltaproteobacteria bacterium]
MLRIKRVYEPVSRADGRRVLVERLWPRGMTKDDAHLDAWNREVAPTGALRTWYGHDVEKWPEFKERYQTELAKRPETWKPLVEAARSKSVTLLFSARDAEHSSAQVLRGFLLRHGAARRSVRTVSRRPARRPAPGR